MSKQVENVMEWVKPTNKTLTFPVVPPDEAREVDLLDNGCDFNAPLSEQSSGGTAVAPNPAKCEYEADLRDVEEAERRLADPNDRIVPFKPSR